MDSPQAYIFKIKLISKYKPIVRAMKNYNFIQGKISNLDRDLYSDLQISSLAFYHLSYPGSIYSDFIL